MTRIRKALIKEFGDESKISVVEAEIGEPGTNEVQVRVEFSSVSGADINMRKGTYPFQKKAPLTPGYSIVGRVEANGRGGKRFQAGERVACLTIYDGQSELVNLPERFLAAVPERVDPRQAVGLVLDWMTAYQMLVRSAHVKAGQRIFVHGLSGAVGRGLLALGKLRGAEIFGTASPSKHADLEQLGATSYPYSNKTWITTMQKSGGVDAVFDPLGFSSFDESEAILKRGGILVAYGMNLPTFTKAPRPRPFFLEFFRVLAKNLKFWAGKRAKFYGLNRKSKYYLPDLGALLKMLEEGKILVPIKRVFKLSEIQEAHRAWAGSEGIGTIVIDVQS